MLLQLLQHDDLCELLLARLRSHPLAIPALRSTSRDARTLVDAKLSSAVWPTPSCRPYLNSVACLPFLRKLQANACGLRAKDLAPLVVVTTGASGWAGGLPVTWGKKRSAKWPRKSKTSRSTGCAVSGLGRLLISAAGSGLSRVSTSSSLSNSGTLHRSGTGKPLLPLQFMVSLSLAHNALGDQGATALAAARLPRLAKLDLEGNRIGPKGAAELARVFSRLQHLRIGRNPLGPGGVAVLASGCWADTLQLLDLACAEVDDMGATDLAAAPWPRLEELHLPYNQVEDAGAKALGRAKWPRCHSIVLSSNLVSGEGARALISSAHLPALRLLVLTRTRVPVNLDEDISWKGQLRV